MRIQLFPVEAGKIFTSSKWCACVDWDPSVPRKFRELTAEGDSRAQALRIIKRRARDLGYTGEFSSYVDSWGNF